MEAKVDLLAGFGHDRSLAQDALRRFRGDVDDALVFLMEGGAAPEEGGDEHGEEGQAAEQAAAEEEQAEQETFCGPTPI